MTDGAVAELWAKLMTQALGYKKFTAADGDLGSGVTKCLALKHADVVAAIHLTDVGYPTGQEDFSSMSEAEQQFAGFIQHWLFTEGAYIMIQSTKPQTIPPVGLASWIVEKLYAWSDCKGDIENRFTKDELLTNIMIYWITETLINPDVLGKYSCYLPSECFNCKACSKPSPSSCCVVPC